MKFLTSWDIEDSQPGIFAIRKNALLKNFWRL